MLTHIKTNQAITNADLSSFVQPWQDALELRVQAQELKQDMAITYKRGVIKFLAFGIKIFSGLFGLIDKLIQTVLLPVVPQRRQPIQKRSRQTVPGTPRI